MVVRVGVEAGGGGILTAGEEDIALADTAAGEDTELDTVDTGWLEERRARRA